MRCLSNLLTKKQDKNMNESKDTKEIESTHLLDKLSIGDVSGMLSQMQSFFLDTINKSSEELSPAYLANLYYESIGKRRHVASRDSFGQTSAAYRTCRKLVRLNLVKELRYKTSGGYSYMMYIALR